MKKISAAALALVCILTLAPAAMAGDWESCDGFERSADWGRKGRYCEIRQLELAALPRLEVDAGHNGGIRVTAWDRSEIHIEARVMVWEASEARATEIARGIEIREDGGRVEAAAPTGENWSVSYRIQAPRLTDLDLTAHNGGISVSAITGRLRLETHNGGLSLNALAGDVRARTRNGGVHVELVGAYWEGEGLDVETRNGGVKLEIPEDYSAELETGTVNGRIRIDFPVTVQGRIDRDVRTTLGAGGAPLRVRTTNGSVTVLEL